MDVSKSKAHNKLGTFLQRTGELQQAAAQYNKAIEIQPHYPHAHFNLAMCLYDMQDIDGR